MKEKIQELIAEQLASWELAKQNYAALGHIKMKDFRMGGATYRVQFNPARILSSAAKVDTQSIKERKCFLCPANLPPMQKGIPFGDKYQILVNPYPIFPKHLTIPNLKHINQRIAERFGDMLDLAEAISDCVIFYNGPKCGASAPDHAHFQAGNKGFLPIEQEWRSYEKEKLITKDETYLWHLNDSPRTTLVIEAKDKEAAITLFQLVYQGISSLSAEKKEDEPMMNILAWKEEAKWIVCIFPRSKHRPSCYMAEGDSNLFISPASVDMGGVFITPQEKDFEKTTAEAIKEIIEEVCLSPTDIQKFKQAIQP